MNEGVIPSALIIDMKKFRIRIHRPTLRAIGNPKLIQLLVNPEKRAVAIRAVGQEVPDEPDVYRLSGGVSSELGTAIFSLDTIQKLESTSSNG